MISLDQVRGFVAVAEELHFGRAAERLNMTQPPLSRQIQRLESEIGVQLLERTPRAVQLTSAGQAFLEDARRLLRLAEAAPDSARRVADGWSGSLSIGFTASWAYRLLGDFLKHMSVSLPGVNLELTELATAQQLEGLLNGDLDLGFARPPFDAALFESMLVEHESLAVVAPLGHHLLRLRRPLTADDLAGEDFIMHSPTNAQYFYGLTAAVLAGRHVVAAHNVSQLLTMMLLVAARRGIALVPQSAERLAIDGLAFAELADPPEVELHAVWPRGARNPILPRVRNLLERMLEDANEASPNPKKVLD
jgi:DNA-binding transcriptional LysR family regulator